MGKLQAHMALAAMSQNQHHHKVKHVHRPNIGSSSSHEFSPPSQIMSNYANYDSATRVPMWHHGFPSATKSNGNSNNKGQSLKHSNTGDFHHYFYKPETQEPQQILPSVHPSIITPFLEQVHLKQKEFAAEQKNSFKQSQESSSVEVNGSFEIVNDVFSKHLVPPPPSSSLVPTKVHRKQPRQPEKIENHPKFNLSMQSPLQDASRFNYNNVVSTATPRPSSVAIATINKALNDSLRYRPQGSAAAPPYYLVDQSGIASTTEKPNIFLNLNRSKENPYKQHKLLHPSYTGGLRKKPSFNHDKPFLPTPYKPEKDEDIKIDYDPPQHSFFTIEDAVTPHFPESLKYEHQNNRGSDELEIITLRPQIKPTKDYSMMTTTISQIPSITTSISPSAVEAPLETSSTKPRQKLRRRKPKPQNQQQQQQQATKEQQQQLKVSIEEHKNEDVTHKKIGSTRGNIKSNNSTTSQDSELRVKNRLNHPNRVRVRPNFSSSASTLSASNDYDYSHRTGEELGRRSETTVQSVTEGTTTTDDGGDIKSIESSEQSDVIRHRVRLRYKNKLNAKVNSLEEIGDFKTKYSDSQISDTENENVVVRQQAHDTDTTEIYIATENPFNEIKSSFKLPNLKLRSEVLTTTTKTPTTAETSYSTSAGVSSSTIETDENNISQKNINRPRFSIKELKRKQFLTSTTTASTILVSSNSPATSQKPDSQRFNRFRLSLNRRRNETITNESNEDIEVPRKRYSSTKFSSTSSPLSSTATSTENTPFSTKRTIILKRTFLTRNFTKPTINLNDIEVTTPKPSIKNSTSFGSNRPSLRQRIQTKRKELSSLNEVPSNDLDNSIKNVTFNFETTIMNDQTSLTTTTSTESPIITRETSIMKIAKTPPNLIKATTSNSNIELDDTLLSSLSERHDVTDLISLPSEHSQRVAELTISGNENSIFKSANIGQLSRRIPNYFTISTDDPILPIQAFFPQIKTNENVNFN